MYTMLWMPVFFLLVQKVIADYTQCSSDQPTATAPHGNVWLALSEEELKSVSALLRRHNFTAANPER